MRILAIAILSASALPLSAAVSVDRGESIVRNISVCGGCHSGDEKNPDGALSGGKEFRDWRVGVARASNLTPDPETGLGTWSEGEIVRAIRNGVRKDGRLLAPVMPYEWFHDMSDDDAFSVARYLKSLPPVVNAVHQDPSLALKVGKHTVLEPKTGPTPATPPAGVTAAYGGYLAQHVGLCAECHTQRTGVKSEPDKSRLLAGMNAPPKDFPVHPSNLTPDDETGIGRWTAADFIRTLRTGVDPAGVKLHPMMPWHQIGRMSDDELRAMFAFLKSLPAIHNSAAPAGKSTPNK
jgi:cytochrome c553